MSAPLELVPLGGVGEFGRNVLWLKWKGSSILIDVGVSFPDETIQGIDRIAPDLSALRDVAIDAVILTHGHEDHIGALPLLREWCSAPVYGLAFTVALARRRLEEAGRSCDRLIELRPRERTGAGAFAVTAYRVAHSVPDSAAVLIEVGGFRILHSGDFKLDADPPDGERTDEDGIRAAAESGIDVALVDSTNAEQPGRSLSERVAGEGLEHAFAGAPGRIVLTTFSSHVARIAQSVAIAQRSARRVGFLGRSVQTVAEIAERQSRLSLPAGLRLAREHIREQPRNRLLCFASGSQGEPFSALYRLALDEHADLKLEDGDLVVFSARTIPGHERPVNRVVDHLVRRGARVIRTADPPVHVSGHAHSEEIGEWLSWARPRIVVPVHGERRMLAAVLDVAVASGIPRDRVCLLDNGDRLTLSDAGSRIDRSAVAAGRIYLDARQELVDPEVVRDRRQLAEEGFVAIFVPAAGADAEIAVASRGVAGAEDDIAREIRRAVLSVLSRATPAERADSEWVRAEVALAAKRACRRAFDLRPVIVPVIV